MGFRAPSHNVHLVLALRLGCSSSPVCCRVGSCGILVRRMAGRRMGRCDYQDEVLAVWVGFFKDLPPPPLGDGRGEAPGWGVGGDPKRGRAGVRSAGCGAAAPCLSRKQWIQASIRTRAGDGSVAFHGAVHVLIRCFHDCMRSMRPRLTRRFQAVANSGIGLSFRGCQLAGSSASSPVVRAEGSRSRMSVR